VTPWTLFLYVVGVVGGVLLSIVAALFVLCVLGIIVIKIGDRFL